MLASRIYHLGSHRILLSCLWRFYLLDIASGLCIQLFRIRLDCVIHTLRMLTPHPTQTKTSTDQTKIFITPLFFPKFYLYWVHL